jgi:hypothetical protein
LFGFGAIGLERMIGPGRRVFRYGAVGFTVVTGCVLDTVYLPMAPPADLAAYYQRHPAFRQLGFLRWTDSQDHALPADFADMLGWEEMAMKTAWAYESLDSLGQAGALVNCGADYGEGGALEYFGPKYSLPPVMGSGADYVLWTPGAYFDRDVFIVATRDVQDLKRFTGARIVDSVTHPYSREYGSYIVLLRGPSAAVRQEWKRKRGLFY